jgi:hypothetical protein
MTKTAAYIYGVVIGYWIGAGYAPTGIGIYGAGFLSLVLITIAYYLEKQDGN